MSDDLTEQVAEQVANLPKDEQIDFLLRFAGALGDDRDRWQKRANSLKCLFVATNQDRRFAWRELRHENELHVEVKKERDELRAENARLDALHAEQRLQRIAERNRLEAVVDAAREYTACWNAWQQESEHGGKPSAEVVHRKAAASATLMMRVRDLDVTEGK